VAIPGVPDLAGLLPGFVEKLPGGLVVSQFAKDGIEVVVGAPEGSTIAFEEVSQSDDGGSCGVVIVPPERDLDGIRQAAAEYHAAGRTPEGDAAVLERSQPELSAMAAAPAPTGPERLSAMSAGQGEELLYETLSCRIGGSVAWSGSCRRYHTVEGDPGSYYLADESLAGGHGKARWSLRTGRTQHDHAGDGVEVVKWDPVGDINVGDPEEHTIGLEGYGLSISSKITVYPSSITIKRGKADFAAQWNGAERDKNVAAAAASMTKVPDGKRARFTYRIYEYHSFLTFK
jgi:hypothetical protein